MESYFEFLQVAIEHHEDNVKSDNEGYLEPQGTAKICVTQTIKLNHIEENKFSGDIIKWMAFHESFIKLVLSSPQ